MTISAAAYIGNSARDAVTITIGAGSISAAIQYIVEQAQGDDVTLYDDYPAHTTELVVGVVDSINHVAHWLITELADRSDTDRRAPDIVRMMDAEPHWERQSSPEYWSAVFSVEEAVRGG